jgi:hypothetical protein
VADRQMANNFEVDIRLHFQHAKIMQRIDVHSTLDAPHSIKLSKNYIYEEYALLSIVKRCS